ncbi:alpha/beta hydrolase [Actinospica sp.]|uniref:alpha/beta fold hydrolase n=1 Tax=Actinospica sp. TaxID=1872142 RepID=UPI002C617068|nr:alpha/beta hydrolase [Actinospica sp.]HWG25702.1 alpha/beta hydrolase [Actinospica sp.]
MTTTWREYTETSVPVPGGDLAVLRWPATEPGAAAPPPPILLVHGITGNALAWAGVVDEIGGRAELIGVDLRGRAGSREIDGPWGIDRNAADLVAVLDALHLEQALLVGHSLGAFVAAQAAATSPKRFTRFVAIDGGLGFPLPPGADADAVLEAIVGPAVKKLSMTFADEQAYLDFHRVHPAFVGNWTPQLTAYLVRDVRMLPNGQVVSSCREEAIRADGKQVLLDEHVRTNIVNNVSCDVDFLYAARGLLNESQALYDPERLALAGLDRTPARIEFVPDTNHYTILAPGAGAQAVARALLR